MEYADIVNLISSVGFPIVCCVVMFRSMETERSLHAEESKELTGIINDLKIAIQQLTDYIRIGGKDE